MIWSSISRTTSSQLSQTSLTETDQVDLGVGNAEAGETIVENDHLKEPTEEKGAEVALEIEKLLSDRFTKEKFKTSLTLVSSFKLTREKGKKDLSMLVKSEPIDSDLSLLRMPASKGETRFG